MFLLQYVHYHTLPLLLVLMVFFDRERYSVSEDAGVARITVRSTKPHTLRYTVIVTAADGTAASEFFTQSLNGTTVQHKLWDVGKILLSTQHITIESIICPLSLCCLDSSHICSTVCMYVCMYVCMCHINMNLEYD